MNAGHGVCLAWLERTPRLPGILTTQHHRACRVVELGGSSRPYRDKQVLYCAVRPCARLLCDAVRLGWPPPSSGRRPLLRVCHTAPACVCLAGRQDSHHVGLRWRLPCPGNRFLCFPDKSASVGGRCRSSQAASAMAVASKESRAACWFESTKTLKEARRSYCIHST